MLNNTLYMGNAAPAGTEIGTLEVGTLVKMNINGAPWEWRVVNQGLPGSMYDSSCDGCWLLLDKIYENRQWNSSDVNDYANSTINAYLNGDFYGMLDSGIQSQVKEVKIPYRPGSGTSANVSSGANGLSCKIFLLSATELSFYINYMPTNEGAELSYFVGCEDAGADNKRIAYLNGSADNWWLRTPELQYGYFTATVTTNGSGTSNNASLPGGIRPALILPSSALVDDELNVLSA